MCSGTRMCRVEDVGARVRRCSSCTWGSGTLGSWGIQHTECENARVQGPRECTHALSWEYLHTELGWTRGMG